MVIENTKEDVSMDRNIRAYIMVRIEHPDIVKHCDKAIECYERNDRTEALKWCRKAMRICKKNDIDPYTIATLHNYFGVICSGRKPFRYCLVGSELRREPQDCSEAVISYEKAIDIFEALGNAQMAAAVYSNLAVHYHENGLTDEARKMFGKAVDACKKYGEDFRGSAIIYCNAALLCRFCDCDFEGARSLLKKALDIHRELGEDCPDTADAYIAIASAYGVLHSTPDKAVEWYNKALNIQMRTLGKDHPLTLETYDAIVDLLEEAGDYEKAIAWLKIQLYDDLSDTRLNSIYFRIGLLYEGLENYEKAKEWYLKSCEPPSDDILNAICRNYKKQGEYDKALEIYLQKYDPACKDHSGCVDIGETYEMKGDRDKAEEWFKKAFELFPYADLCFWAASVCWEQGDVDKAEEWFEKTFELCIEQPTKEDGDGPEQEDWFKELFGISAGAKESRDIGEFYAEHGDNDKAEKWFNKAFELDKNFRICKDIAEIYREKEDHGLAAEWGLRGLNNYGKQEENSLSWCEACAFLGGIYLDGGCCDVALEVYNEAIGAHNERAAARISLGELYGCVAKTYLKMGDSGEALRQLKKALKICSDSASLQPEVAKLCNSIGRTYLSMGNDQEALRWFKKALKICENSPRGYPGDVDKLYDNIAEICVRQGNFGEARELYLMELRRVVSGSTHGDIPDTCRKIADTYEKQGDDIKAKEWAERAER